MEWDVRLLDANYDVVSTWRPGEKERKEKVVVKLYGKTRDNRSITVICPDFKPYCHVFNPSTGLRKEIKEHPDVLSVEDVNLEYKGRQERFSKVTMRAPYVVHKLREEYELKTRTVNTADPALLENLADDGASVKENQAFFEDRADLQRAVEKYGIRGEDYHKKAVFFNSDIVFINRFIYDHDLDCCIRVYGRERDDIYSTDLIVEAESFGRCDVFTPKLKIMSFDIEASIKNGNIYCICASTLNETTGIKTGKKISVSKEWGSEEAKMEEKELIDAFVEHVRLIDPDVITGYNINNYDFEKLYERALLYYKRPERTNGSSNFIRDLNVGRDNAGLSRRENAAGVHWDVHGRLLLDGWVSVKKELHPKRETLGFVSKQLFGDTKDNINSSKIDDEWKARRDEVIDYCLKDADLALRVLIHPKINTISKYMDLAIPARLPVKEVTGGQNKAIESLLIRMVDRANTAVPNQNSEAYGYEGAFVYDTKPGLWEWVIGLDFSAMYPSQIIKHNICFTTYVANPTADFKGDRSPTFTINDINKHACFMSKEERVGIIPRMVDGLLTSRKQAKDNMKACKAKGDKEGADYYNRLQNAIKIMANATYGYFGAKFCRWPFNKFIAPSVTAWAREDIHKVVSALESRDYIVIAGDTDSVMFTTKTYVGVEACRDLGKSIQEEFSQGGMKLELEKVMERFFAHAKKRYFGKIVWPEPSVLVRGYETRRTDSFDLQSDSMTNLFNLVLEGKKEEGVAYAKDIVSSILSGKVPLNELVISKSVGDFESYANPDSLSHVQAAKKAQLAGVEFVPNMKYSYVVVNANSTPIRVEPVMEGMDFHFKPDYKYYAERVAATLARITEAFGCSEDMLLMGKKQKSLADWM